MKILIAVLLSLMIALPAFADPDDAAYPGYDFTTSSGTYFIGLFDIDNPTYPGIVYPALWSKQGSVWYEIDTRPAMWNDQQEDIRPELMASLIVKDFNITLASHGGTPMSWNQKLAAIFQLQLSVENNQLVISS